MVQLELDWLPNLTLIVADFDKLGLDIRSFRVPLERSVRDVIAPSIATNFQVGGRPLWAELASGTVENKDRYGFSSDILIRTGRLERRASQLNLWQIDGIQGTATAGIPADAPYGLYHQDGTSKMPAREWAMIQDEDLTKIEEVFGIWLDERIVGFVARR